MTRKEKEEKVVRLIADSAQQDPQFLFSFIQSIVEDWTEETLDNELAGDD